MEKILRVRCKKNVYMFNESKLINLVKYYIMRNIIINKIYWLRENENMCFSKTFHDKDIKLFFELSVSNYFSLLIIIFKMNVFWILILKILFFLYREKSIWDKTSNAQDDNALI